MQKAEDKLLENESRTYLKNLTKYKLTWDKLYFKNKGVINKWHTREKELTLEFSSRGQI